jgi:AraC-like DNA-binding protein
MLPYFFQRIGIGLTMVDAQGWHGIHVIMVIQWELEFARESARATYNDGCLASAVETKSPVLGRHQGQTDFFVPICRHGGVSAVLIAGPFYPRPLRSTDLLDQWRELSGRYGHLDDPSFARFALSALSTVMLDRRQLSALRRLLVIVATLLASRGDPETLLAEAEQLVDYVAEATFAERMWLAANYMVDPGTARMWQSSRLRDQLAELNMRRVPSHVLVALVANRLDEPDPVEDLVRRNAFQRAAVDLARARGETGCARVGDHGVAFLLPAERSETRARARFDDMARRASSLAKRLRLRLHFGASPWPRAPSLPEDYQAALAAAQRALSLGNSIVYAPARASPRARPAPVLDRLEPTSPLPGDLTARFERHLERAVARAGYRLDAVRLELETEFRKLAEPFLRSGVVDAKTYADLSTTLGRQLDTARVVGDVVAAYRRGVLHFVKTVEHPDSAHRERNLGRALAFIGERLDGPIRLKDVARVAGFSPNHFSRLFRKHEHVSFEDYVRNLRIERAKELLSRSALTVEQIGQLCGISSSPYFHRVFREVAGKTPGAFRRDVLAKPTVRRARAST